MNKIVHAQSGHTLFVKSIKFTELPDVIQLDGHSPNFTEFYIVKNWDDDGYVFMYLGKGLSQSPKQICAWYPKGAFWSSYGTSIKAAIDGAQKDGWMYA